MSLSWHASLIQVVGLSGGFVECLACTQPIMAGATGSGSLEEWFGFLRGNRMSGLPLPSERFPGQGRPSGVLGGTDSTSSKIFGGSYPSPTGKQASASSKRTLKERWIGDMPMRAYFSGNAECCMLPPLSAGCSPELSATFIAQFSSCFPIRDFAFLQGQDFPCLCPLHHRMESPQI